MTVLVITRGQRRPPNSVYVDHPSEWSPPRSWDAAAYTLWLLNGPGYPLLKHIHKLRGKTLVIYDRPGVSITHAHILSALANSPLFDVKIDVAAIRKSRHTGLVETEGDHHEQLDQAADRSVREAGRRNRQDLPRHQRDLVEAPRPRQPQQAGAGQQLPQQGKQGARQHHQRGRRRRG